ncbi:MAG: CHAT domain-containing protein, partial [Tildeniella nuda ZEHNDER 1965/U140]|nr:CHAT domain-containing protein [Tildeniella nuda ZEHNDER 1965/U140]
MELFEIRFSPSATPNRFKAIVVRSSAGEEEDELLLPFTDNGKDWRTTLIKVLEVPTFNTKDFRQEGEQAWMVRARLLTEDFQAFHPDLLKNIGNALYQCLFPSGGKLESILKSALRSAESQNTYLHIQFTFQENSVQKSRFADYPWELMHDETRFLAHRRVTFSRYIAYESAPPNLPLTEKINVLLVSSAAFDAEQGLKKLSN